jgi:hypothetical protein
VSSRDVRMVCPRLKRGDCTSYDTGKALRKWANRNKVFRILTVDSIGEQWDLTVSQLGRVGVLTLILLMWRIGWANSIPIYIQQDATLHSLFISGNCSTCFGWYFHPTSGAHTTVSTASGVCHNTVTAICRYRGRGGTGLSVLWVAYATHSTLKPF